MLDGALAWADYYLTPCFAEPNSYTGLAYLAAAVSEIREDLNPRLQPLGLVVTSVKQRNATHRDFEQQMRELQEATQVHVFRSTIPYSDAVTAAAAQQQSIIDYRADLPVSVAYQALAKEILERIEALARSGPPAHPSTFNTPTF